MPILLPNRHTRLGQLGEIKSNQIKSIQFNSIQSENASIADSVALLLAWWWWRPRQEGHNLAELGYMQCDLILACLRLLDLVDEGAIAHAILTTKKPQTHQTHISGWCKCS